MDDDGDERLVILVALDAGYGCDQQDGVCVALAEDAVLSVELVHGVFGDEELRPIGVGPGVRHGQSAGDGEGERGVDFVGEVEAWIAGAVASGVAALNHEPGKASLKVRPS